MIDVLLSIISFIIGIVVGFAINHVMVRTSTNAKSARQELDKVRNDFRSYQNRVSSHLNKTADLLALIQSSSLEAQEHILASAQSLTQELNKHTALHAANPYLYVEGAETVSSFEVKPKQEKELKPPKDYV